MWEFVSLLLPWFEDVRTYPSSTWGCVREDVLRKLHVWSRMCPLAFATGMVVSCGLSMSMTVKGH